MLLDVRETDAGILVGNQSMNRLALVLAGALISSIAIAVTNHKGLERPATEGDLLRGYALGRCLENAYKGTPFGADASRAAGAYLEIGSSGAEAYEATSKAAEIAAVPPPPGAVIHNDEKPGANSGDHLAIFRCLEFYESPKLKQLAKKANVRPSKN